jgi:phosphoribosylformimino-5-aminoimidazole carboxamide ribonucleotide (ProFAR) isomerase
MIILPAIDIKDGKCVRLRQGEARRVTVLPLATPTRRSPKSNARKLRGESDGALTGELMRGLPPG